MAPAADRYIGRAISREAPGEEMLPGHDLTNGWRDLFARGLEIVQSPGDHVSMMADGHLTTVARQIKEVLDRYEAVQNMETAVASPPS